MKHTSNGSVTVIPIPKPEKKIELQTHSNKHQQNPGLSTII